MFSEKPVLFGRSGSLMGIVCSPETPAGTPTVVFLNAGIVHRVGPNRLYVKLARALAAEGVASLRFDLGGIGDSWTDRSEQGSLLELVERDIADAIEHAASSNPAGVVLIGMCSGADNAFGAAVRHEGVVGAVFMDPAVHRPWSFYFHKYRRAFFLARTWKMLLAGTHPATTRLRRAATAGQAPLPEITPFLAPTALPPRETMLEQITAMLERGCTLLYVFTGGLSYRYNHASQFWRTFPALRGSRGLELRYFGGADHTFSDPALQGELIRTISAWLKRPRSSVVPAVA